MGGFRTPLATLIFKWRSCRKSEAGTSFCVCVGCGQGPLKGGRHQSEIFTHTISDEAPRGTEPPSHKVRMFEGPLTGLKCRVCSQMT